MGCPLLIGLSRKAFIGHVLGDPAADRTAGTIGAALAAARQGVGILRVHDVAAVRQALLALRGGRRAGVARNGQSGPKREASCADFYTWNCSIPNARQQEESEGLTMISDTINCSPWYGWERSPPRTVLNAG